MKGSTASIGIQSTITDFQEKVLLVVDAFISVVSNSSYQGREQILGTEK